MVSHENKKGFTIVELLIVIVVIGILASITLVAYNGIQDRARATLLKSDLNSGSKQLGIDYTIANTYPANLAAANGGQGLKSSNGVTFRYTTSPGTFCLSASDGTRIYKVTETTSPEEGSCVNVALGASAPSTLLTDGSTASNPYYSASSGPQSVVVNLGSVQDISMVKVWHYHSGGRTYNGSKTEVSEDGSNWFTIFDSATDGTYPESSAGKTHTFAMRKVRFIRDSINGSNVNTGNHWVEIQAY